MQPLTPAQLLQTLIRFDTTNPPGNEAACIAYIDGLLKDAGIETTILEKFPGRPNLIARLKGTGNAPPLLLYGHVDVVTTEGQDWTHPPFAAEIHDGYIWGRGAIDMKGGVAMLVSAFIRAKTENLPLPGDVLLCILSDEEVGGAAGAAFLVEEHPDLFTGICYALGEFGGFSFTLGGRRFYPIMVAEKQACHLRATVRGAAGHASLPIQGGAMAKTARMLEVLDQKRLPVHVVPAARHMVETMSASLPFPANFLMRQLLNPALTDRVIDLMGAQGRTFNALLHHTVSPTIIQGGNKINVIPGQIQVEMDARLLPGFTPDDLLPELRALIGDEIELEVLNFSPGPGEPDMGLFNTLSDILREADPKGVPIPLMLAGVTDGRFFSRLGIQTYGFLPMQLPPDFNFIATVHAADERIPVEAVDFGTNQIYKALQRFTA